MNIKRKTKMEIALDKVLIEPETREKLRLEIPKLVPIQRQANPVEIANVLIYVVSDESRFVIRTELFIDGSVANV